MYQPSTLQVNLEQWSSLETLVDVWSDKHEPDNISDAQYPEEGTSGRSCMEEREAHGSMRSQPSASRMVQLSGDTEVQWRGWDGSCSMDSFREGKQLVSRSRFALERALSFSNVYTEIVAGLETACLSARNNKGQNPGEFDR